MSLLGEEPGHESHDATIEGEHVAVSCSGVPVLGIR